MGHWVDTAFERGWSNLRNGELLDHAEADGYQLLIDTGVNRGHPLLHPDSPPTIGWMPAKPLRLSDSPKW